MADDEEPQEFDFGKKKKKKEKKDGEKKAKDGAEDAEEGGGGDAVVLPWERGPVYEYQELLSRLFKIIEDKNPALGGAAKKYIMKPPQVVRVGSKKVGWINFSEICQIMKRPTDHVLAFVLAEFGTEGSIGGEGQLILRGAYKEKHAESLLRKYIKEFVSCDMCKSANTTLVRDSSTRLHVVNCQNCGASRTANSIKTGYHAVTRKDRKAAKQKA
uniref:Translation initiation factor IF2/IF5 domain-containing protein n=1 Tax=Zooxanthella nutricula TaxID=1333877 RepID=A0A6U6JR95_9DINO|mmetsp:Transcript_2448/g.7367  ORF Transcript_2448/g.7367 Transcript_2448/m.7367 type:complete len:215 (+) Transcript_2448:91-735(+)